MKTFLCKHKELVFQTSIRNPLIEKLFFSGNYKKLSLFINSFFDKREKFFLESIRNFFFESESAFCVSIRNFEWPRSLQFRRLKCKLIQKWIQNWITRSHIEISHKNYNFNIYLISYL